LKGHEHPRRLAQSPFGAIADHRPADPARGREADTDQARPVAAIARLGRNGADSARLAPGRGQEVRSFLQPFNGGLAAGDLADLRQSGACGPERGAGR
jgi:hypothetical protein